MGKAVGDKAASFLLPKLVAAFERNTWNKKGLKEGWLKVSRETLASKALSAGKPASEERSLLFIHGTFSNAASAYGALAASNFFDRVKETYSDRIYAFDHFSLSRTPEEDPRMFWKACPTRPRHSILLRYCAGDWCCATFFDAPMRLGPLAKRFKLGRAVLVASPNEGPRSRRPTLERYGRLACEPARTVSGKSVHNRCGVRGQRARMAGAACAGIFRGCTAMDGNGELIADLQSPPDSRRRRHTPR